MYKKIWSYKCTNNYDETNATQLQEILLQITVTAHCVMLQRTAGMDFSRLCLLRNVNKQKRLEWAKHHIQDYFANVIFTDEASKHIACGATDQKERGKTKNLNLVLSTL